MIPVPAKSIDKVWAHIEGGKRVCVPTMTRVTIIDAKVLAKFRKAGAYLLREDGEGYRMQTGKSSVYILPGQLKFID